MPDQFESIEESWFKHFEDTNASSPNVVTEETTDEVAAETVVEIPAPVEPPKPAPSPVPKYEISQRPLRRKKGR